MKTLLQKLLHKISLASIQGNKNSTPRVQSFLLLLPILFMAFSYIAFEYFRFIISIKNGVHFNISAESIIIYGMLLSHHLALVFSRKTSQSIEEIKGTKKDSTTDEPLEEEIK